MFLALAMVGILLPLGAAYVERGAKVLIAERHHRHHDTYSVPPELTNSLVKAMVVMGGVGVVLGVLSSGLHTRAQSTGSSGTVGRPSPLASAEAPPVATTTALAATLPACGAHFSPGAAGEKTTFQPPAARATDVTSRAGASVTPARRARARSTSRTEAAWRESG